MAPVAVAVRLRTGFVMCVLECGPVSEPAWATIRCVGGLRLPPPNGCGAAGALNSLRRPPGSESGRRATFPLVELLIGASLVGVLVGYLVANERELHEEVALNRSEAAIRAAQDHLFQEGACPRDRAAFERHLEGRIGSEAMASLSVTDFAGGSDYVVAVLRHDRHRWWHPVMECALGLGRLPSGDESGVLERIEERPVCRALEMGGEPDSGPADVFDPERARGVISALDSG